MRQFYCAALLLFTAGAFGSSPASQTDFPARSVRVIVGYPPGGTLDGPARIVANALSQKSGQQFVIENRPGASANISADMVAKAKPDGYTLLLSSSSLSSSGALFKNLSFDPIKDFHHIGRFGSLPTVIVARKDLPQKTLQEVIDYSNKNPGKLTFGSPGSGTGAHIAGEVLNRYAHAQITHIPFKGSAQTLTNLLGGHIDLMIGGLSTIDSAVKGGQVTVLALTNADSYSDLIDAQPVQKVLNGTNIPREYQFETWLGLSAPAKTPDDVVAKLQTLLQSVLQDPKVQKELLSIGVKPGFLSGDDLRKQIEKEMPAYAKIIKQVGVKLD
ncbi:hypothetical protein W822_04765 [Advenella kashmirensis W13003]|uniref:ABC transporter substrate-binding protein n=1 Tax=Advenella kashmirensis W13003 TaxID=1424334 RepID=V8R0D7_9BURK|nr:hypothetical protein W822_04765 [Advenella kashmirensis W13003]